MLLVRILLYSFFCAVVLSCGSPVKQCPPLQYRYGEYLIQFPITVAQAKRNFSAFHDGNIEATNHKDFDKSTVIIYHSPYIQDPDSASVNDMRHSPYAITINRPTQPDSVRRKLSADFKKPFSKKRWVSSEGAGDYYLLRINECHVALIHRSFTNTTQECPWVVTFGNDLTNEDAERFVRTGGIIDAFKDYLK